MRAMRVLPFIAVLLAAFAAPLLLGQNKDLSGTWVGSTAVPNMDEKDTVTLVLKSAGKSYTGTISDSMGVARAASLENVKVESETLSFDFAVTINDQSVSVRMQLKITGDKLVGSWSTGDNDAGALELSRQK